jgi:hypothetical protein
MRLGSLAVPWRTISAGSLPPRDTRRGTFTPHECANDFKNATNLPKINYSSAAFTYPLTTIIAKGGYKAPKWPLPWRRSAVNGKSKS